MLVGLCVVGWLCVFVCVRVWLFGLLCCCGVAVLCWRFVGLLRCCVAGVLVSCFGVVRV